MTDNVSSILSPQRSLSSQGPHRIDLCLFPGEMRRLEGHSISRLQRSGQWRGGQRQCPGEGTSGAPTLAPCVCGGADRRNLWKENPPVCLLICAFSDTEVPGSGLSLGLAVSQQMDSPGPALKERSVSWTSKSAKTQAQQDVLSIDAGAQAAGLGLAAVSVSLPAPSPHCCVLSL